MSIQGQSAYQASLESYWSTQESSLQPSCIVSVTAKDDVARAVAILNAGNCRFAVRSGGHAPAQGWANIAGGVTLDLQGLKQITISEDRQEVDIGPGNRWGDIYRVLDAEGLSVVGGRASPVGVGGLLLGGGISFFSPRYGYAADNVVSFEIVLASGEVVTASAETNADLYKALKGGSNNFGVVISFTLRTFEIGRAHV